MTFPTNSFFSDEEREALINKVVDTVEAKTQKMAKDAAEVPYSVLESWWLSLEELQDRSHSDHDDDLFQDIRNEIYSYFKG